MPRKKEVLSYTLYIPENLDIDAMLAAKPPDFRYKRDNFVYIASLPYSIMESYRNRDKEYEIALNSGYVPFYSRIIKQKINNYKPYIQYFMDNGVLECDGKSSKDGGKSFGYRFTLEYTTTPKPVTIERCSLIKQLKNRTRPNIEEDEVLPETPLSEVPYLTKWFNPELRIDIEKVKIFLKNLYQIDKEVKGKDYALRKEITLWMSAQRIDNGIDYNLSIDRKGKRFYSPLTNLKSELRAYVTYNSQKLVSLDLKSSQPFFSLVLLDTNPFDRFNVGNILSLYSDYLYLEDNNIDLYIERLRSLIKERECKRDIYEYKKSIIFDEAFYEKTGVKIGTFLNQPFDEEITMESLNKQRDITKIKTLIMMYSKWSNKKFKSHYPNVDEIFSLIKQKDHRVFAWVLQYIEADMLLYKVCPQIAAEASNIPLFTIHDAIITTEEHAEFVKYKMIEIIQETIGFTPMIEPELWEEGNTALVDRKDLELLEEETE